jgi:hypothetical protein
MQGGLHDDTVCAMALQTFAELGGTLLLGLLGGITAQTWMA